MPSQKKQVALAVLISAPPFAWKYSGSQGEEHTGLEFHRRMALTAEKGKFDVFFLADSYGVKDDRIGLQGMRGSSTVFDFEPTALLCALAAVTQNIGLVGTVSTTYNEPFNVARRIASLDHLSGGRGGWNVITSTFDAEAKNFNLDAQLSNEERYSRANEFLDVVFDLWDTWEDGALLNDKQAGVFFDPDRIHYLDHRGKHFKVRGPLNIPRSPQGRPVICQAGASEAGWDFAARTADVMYAKAASLAHGKEFYTSMKGRLRKYGRERDDLKILPGLITVVGRTEKEAQEKFRAVQDCLNLKDGLAFLRQFFRGIDFSVYPLDEPVPDLAHINDLAESLRINLQPHGQRLTVRGLMDVINAALGHLILIGTGKQIADTLEHWVQEEACDGFNLMPHYLPGSVEDFVECVVPELQESGAFRADYVKGATLRETLGLPAPANRLAMARRGLLQAAG